MESPQAQLEDLIRKNRRIVFFGGAGVSTESGIPDFRSPKGLYQKSADAYPWPAETILSLAFFRSRPDIFFRYYRQCILYPDARPNAAHQRLAQLETEDQIEAIITQNIDGLHQAAGSRRVLELHGSVHRNTCQQCKQKFGLDAIFSSKDIPTCPCGGIIKPDVVLYGEGLDQLVISQAIQSLKNADLLIIGGTSLTVYPAAGLIDHADAARIVLINQAVTAYDNKADLVIREPIGQVMGQHQLSEQ